MHAVFVKSYPAPAMDRAEILRYAGVRGVAPLVAQLLDECIAALEGKLSYRVCYCELACDALPLRLARSRSLTSRLSGCVGTVLFAATVGTEIDRMIARYGAISPTKALLFQAIGAERIEALCDAFCADIGQAKAAQGCRTTPRFSPGYGDLALEAQQEMFALLDPARRIGLSLNQSLLMTPSKSVTAILGFAESKESV